MPDYKTSSQGHSRRGGATKVKGRDFVPTFYLRLTAVAAALAATSLSCFVILSHISKPYVLRAQQSSEIVDKTQALKMLNVQNAELSQQAAFLNRPDGIEYEARLHGYLMPGERSLVLNTNPNSH